MDTKISQKGKLLNFFRISTVSQIIKDILKYKRSGSVLDLGAGIGRNSFFLAKKGFSVTALDKDTEAILKLKKLAKKMDLKIKTMQNDLINFQNKQKYDVIIAINSLHFLKKSQIPKIITKIQSTTKANGLNVISVHTDKNPLGSRPYLFTSQELKRFYSEWKILKYKENLGLPYRTSLTGKIIRKHRAVIIARKID